MAVVDQRGIVCKLTKIPIPFGFTLVFHIQVFPNYQQRGVVAVTLTVGWGMSPNLIEERPTNLQIHITLLNSL